MPGLMTPTAHRGIFPSTEMCIYFLNVRISVTTSLWDLGFGPLMTDETHATLNIAHCDVYFCSYKFIIYLLRVCGPRGCEILKRKLKTQASLQNYK